MTWETKNNILIKEYTFKNYIDAINFINKITPLAETLNHHPDILIHSYKKVKIMLITHSENKITNLDYKLAKKIDLIK
jgi:4a-hydroxytetrahydrobiopterin dehydratase